MKKFSDFVTEAALRGSGKGESEERVHNDRQRAFMDKNAPHSSADYKGNKLTVWHDKTHTLARVHDKAGKEITGFKFKGHHAADAVAAHLTKRN